MVKYVPNILAEIDNNPELIHTHMKDSAFSIIMSYAFDPDKKMLLPEGAPEFKKDSAPLGMSPSTLRYESKRLYVFCRQDLSRLKRETLFIQLLESLHPSEADVLLAVKDQALDKVYPNITRKLMSTFGICDYPNEDLTRGLPKCEESDNEVVQSTEQEQSVEPVKRGRGRPKRTE